MQGKRIAVIAVAAAGVTAAAAGALLFFHGSGTPSNSTAATDAPLSAVETTTQAATQAAPGTTAAVPSTAQAAGTTAAGSREGEAAAFSGVYVPDSRAEETATGKVVHVRELFGIGYQDGALTFHQDGTFSDTLVMPEGRSGTYRTVDDTIETVCESGKAPVITVTAWKDDGVTPAAFCAVYPAVGDNGYRVYFSERS